MESLKLEKFKPLSVENMLQIKGGAETKGGTKVITYDSKTIDGVRYRRPYMKSWTADDITSEVEQFTNLEYCYGEWEAY